MTSIEQTLGSPYEGICSFCRFPLCFDLSKLEADIAVAGVCLDTGSLNRSGARFGPRAIREASMIYYPGFSPEGIFDIELGKHLLGGKKIIDCGDITTAPTMLQETFDIITDSVSKMRECGAMPVILGGDHSISYPVLRSFNDSQLHVIQFDAHLDLLDDFAGLKYTHANPMKRIIEMDHVSGATQIGIRGLLNPEYYWTESVSKKSRYFTAEQVFEKGIDHIVSQIPESENIYITLDIDSLDPSIAPGTGTPEFGGLSYRQLRKLLQASAKKGKLIGMDLVEVNPLFDPTGRTAQIASRLIIDLLGAAF